MLKKILAYLLLLCLIAACTVETFGQPSPVLSSGPAFPDIAELPIQTPSPSSPGPSASSLPGDASPPPEDTAVPAAQPSAEPPRWPVVLSDPLDQVFANCEGFYGSVLIEKDGEILLYKAYGKEDAEKGTLNTPATRFLIGSVTKQFTSMAIMQLYEKGLLDLRDKLADYIPDFARGGEIDLLNLLRHTSGITDYMNDTSADVVDMPTGELTQEYIIDRVKALPLKFDPGSKYSYSNTNYLILSYIVEKVGGLPFADYLARNIFDVLGMEDTGVYDINNPPENMATGHRGGDTPVRFFTETGEIDAEAANATAAGYGAGGLYSTTGDLYLWDQALTTEKLLPKKYMDMLFTETVPVPGALIPSDYGLGWIIQSDPDCGTIREHTGTLGGFRAFNALFADLDITVIILYNNMSFPGRNELIPAVKRVLLAS